MHIKVQIHDLEDEDSLEESSRKPLNLDIDPELTFEDLKQMIEEKEDYDLGERQLLIDGDTVTAQIASENGAEGLTVRNFSTETIYMIINRSDNFDILPFFIKEGISQ
eukprot:TRINITY_DN8651_c0_g1_i1.p2 TRINITY_DN8651_c0_g1~~TRINITY_DN8651_c0_g1_i1.p2  ORF type:complete len:108 (+),score=23.95 TRINITY_DN8651_c0_g1_i1:376-699(+)